VFEFNAGEACVLPTELNPADLGNNFQLFKEKNNGQAVQITEFLYFGNNAVTNLYENIGGLENDLVVKNDADGTCEYKQLVEEVEYLIHVNQSSVEKISAIVKLFSKTYFFPFENFLELANLRILWWSTKLQLNFLLRIIWSVRIQSSPPGLRGTG
jgi:hypothetical protein